MSMRKSILGPALCGGALLFGCDDGRGIDSVQVSAQPLALEGALLYPHQADVSGDALIVDISHRDPAVIAHHLPPGNVRGYARPASSGREVVVLTQGTSLDLGRSQRDATGAALMVFDRNGERFRKELEGRFTDVALSPDGRLAVVYGHGEGTGVDVGNTVAFVDLDDPRAPARKLALSDSSGRAMESFAFPDPADGSRRVILARGRDTFSLIELDHLDRDPIEIPIKLPNDPRALSPGKILFRANEIFVQLQNSSDILVLQLIPDDSRGVDGFRVAPLFLATGSNVLDFELIGEGGADRRLVALGQSRVSVMDPITGDATSTQTTHGFGDLLRFEGSSPVDQEIRERGLLVQLQGGAITFVDFNGGRSVADQNLETLVLPAVVESVIQLAHHRLVVLGYRGGGIGLVDLERRKVTPIGTGALVTSTLVDESPSDARLWFTLNDGRVARVDLLRLESREILLAAPADRLLMVEGTPRQIAADHGGHGGFVTLLNPDDPTPDQTRELAAFFYSGILD